MSSTAEVCTVLLVAGVAAFVVIRCCRRALAQKAAAAPLIEAVKRGDLAAAQLLLDQGADPNAREVVLTVPSLADRTEGGKRAFGDAALMIAMSKGHIELVKLLLRKGANVNRRGVTGDTPLINSVRWQRIDLAKVLLEHGARPNQRDDYGDTAIVFAAIEGSTALIDLMLKNGADINGGSGWTPLMAAAYNGQEDVVKFLIAKGANVNLTRNGLMTPLEYALAQGKEEAAVLISKADGKGRSPEALREEKERAAAKWEAKLRATQGEAERRPKAQRQCRDRALTAEDQQVIETVLLHLLSNKSLDLPGGNTSSPDIILVDMTAPGDRLLTDSSINSEVDVSEANDVPLEIREHLLRRNGEPTSLAAFTPTGEHILVESGDAVASRFSNFRDKAPHARAWVCVYLPGYSKSRDRAVLRFWLGPSSNGAAGIYFLMKQDDRWQVGWGRVGFFL